MSTFRGATCDQCNTDGKHPGHGLPAGPLRGWHRVTNDCGVAYDFCSIKCAIEWLKERRRQQTERAKRQRELAANPPASSPRIGCRIVTAPQTRKPKS